MPTQHGNWRFRAEIGCQGRLEMVLGVGPEDVAVCLECRVWASVSDGWGAEVVDPPGRRRRCNREANAAKTRLAGSGPVGWAGDTERPTVDPVGVDHRGVEVAVAQQLLRGADVGSCSWRRVANFPCGRPRLRARSAGAHDPFMTGRGFAAGLRGCNYLNFMVAQRGIEPRTP